MSNLLQKASIVTTPTAYGVGVLNSIKPAYALSLELVINGDFATDGNWVKGSGWTISGGSANGSNTTGDLYQENVVEVGKKYKVTYTISNYVSGSVRVELSNNAYAGIERSANGTYTETILSGSTTVLFDARTSFTGSIDNVSVKEVTDADFEFTRTSSATRVNPDYLIETVSINSANLVQNGNFSELGSDIIVNGNFETDTDWNLRSVWVISNGVCSLTPPNSDYLSQSNVFTANKFYKLSFDIVVNSGSLEPQFFDSGFQTIGTYSTTQSVVVYFESTSSGTLYFKPNSFDGSIDNVSVKQVDPNDNWTLGTSWSFGENKAIYTTGSVSAIEQNIGLIGSRKYKITINNSGSGINLYLGSNTTAIGVPNGLYEQTLTTASNTNGIFALTNVAAASSGSITDISVIEIQENGVPRLDYTNGTASILLEPQSTNLLPYSEDFSQWSSSGNITKESGYLAPDGTNNAYKITDNNPANNNTSLFLAAVTAADNSRTIYAKTVSGTGTAKLFTHNSNTNNLFTITEQWQRFEINSVTSSIGEANFYAIDFRNGGSLNEIILWGAQTEALSYPTSYIPTSGSTVTRAAETLTNSGNSDLINSTEGVFYAEIAALANDGTYRMISLSDGTVNNSTNIQFSGVSNQIRTRVENGGIPQATISSNVTSQTLFHKIAVLYKSNKFELWANGFKLGEDTSGTPPSGINKLSFDRGDGLSDFYGKCKTVAVFKEALSDTELACLTSTNNREIFLNYYYRMQYVGANTEALSCAEQTFNI